VNYQILTIVNVAAGEALNFEERKLFDQSKDL